jgi:hypothetical protein
VTSTPKTLLTNGTIRVSTITSCKPIALLVFVVGVDRGLLGYCRQFRLAQQPSG